MSFHLANRALTIPVVATAAVLGVPTVRIPAAPNQRSKRLYLTFDDGPTAEHTLNIADTLAKYHASATFFVTTTRLTVHGDVIRALKNAGHDVATHGHTHRDPWRLSRKHVVDDFEESIDILAGMGAPPVWFRPPYGHFRLAHLHSARARGIRLAGWSVMPGDFRPSATGRRVFNDIKKSARPGAIIVLHDNDSVAARGVTVQALQETLDYFSNEGWEFTALPRS